MSTAPTRGHVEPVAGPGAAAPTPDHHGGGLPSLWVLVPLVAATSFAVGSVSVWLILPYLGLMGWLLLAPGRLGAADEPAEDAPGSIPEPMGPAARSGPRKAVKRRLSDPPDPTSEPSVPSADQDAAEPASPEPPPAKPRKGRGRSRASKAPAPEPVEVSWRQVGPGKFVRVESPASEPELTPEGLPAEADPRSEPAATADVEPPVEADSQAESTALEPPQPSPSESEDGPDGSPNIDGDHPAVDPEPPAPAEVVDDGPRAEPEPEPRPDPSPSDDPTVDGPRVEERGPDPEASRTGPDEPSSEHPEPDVPAIEPAPAPAMPDVPIPSLPESPEPAPIGTVEGDPVASEAADSSASAESGGSVAGEGDATPAAPQSDREEPAALESGPVPDAPWSAAVLDGGNVLPQAGWPVPAAPAFDASPGSATAELAWPVEPAASPVESWSEFDGETSETVEASEGPEFPDEGAWPVEPEEGPAEPEAVAWKGPTPVVPEPDVQDEATPPMAGRRPGRLRSALRLPVARPARPRVGRGSSRRARRPPKARLSPGRTARHRTDRLLTPRLKHDPRAPPAPSRPRSRRPRLGRRAAHDRPPRRPGRRRRGAEQT